MEEYSRLSRTIVGLLDWFEQGELYIYQEFMKDFKMNYHHGWNWLEKTSHDEWKTNEQEFLSSISSYIIELHERGGFYGKQGLSEYELGVR